MSVVLDLLPFLQEMVSIILCNALQDLICLIPGKVGGDDVVVTDMDRDGDRGRTVLQKPTPAVALEVLKIWQRITGEDWAIALLIRNNTEK